MRKFQNTVMMFALILAVGLVGCGPNGSTTVPVPNGSVTLSSKTVQTTEKGTRVESEKGIDASLLPIIDAGLTQAFADGKASGWADNGIAYNYSRYTIKIPVEPCKLSPESHTPSFLVNAQNYDGTIYDQYNSKGELPADQQDGWKKYVVDGVGVVYAAEQVVAFNTEGSTNNGVQNQNAAFVACPDASDMKNAVDYGAEHVIAAWYDADYFALTQTHSTIGHPILPKRQLGRGLSVKTAPKSVSVVQPLTDLAK